MPTAAPTDSAVVEESPVSMTALTRSECSAATAAFASPRTRSESLHAATISPSATTQSTLAPAAAHAAGCADESESGEWSWPQQPPQVLPSA